MISEAFLRRIIHRQSYREDYPSIQAREWKVFCNLWITHASSAVQLKLDLFRVPLQLLPQRTTRILSGECKNTAAAGDRLTDSIRLLNTKSNKRFIRSYLSWPWRHKTDRVSTFDSRKMSSVELFLREPYTSAFWLLSMIYVMAWSYNGAGEYKMNFIAMIVRTQWPHQSIIN